MEKKERRKKKKQYQRVNVVEMFKFILEFMTSAAPKVSGDKVGWLFCRYIMMKRTALKKKKAQKQTGRLIFPTLDV